MTPFSGHGVYQMVSRPDTHYVVTFENALAVFVSAPTPPLVRPPGAPFSTVLFSWVHLTVSDFSGTVYHAWADTKDGSGNSQPRGNAPSTVASAEP